ncbi:hypothetical protein M9Y10_044593 [Tritrichomonas musculus]|uniref:Uncharacterized protein n=1 Tax=Tritrichomonas musculus TaxID=1915356 RepID=A0ABR2JST4_9EUKA
MLYRFPVAPKVHCAGAQLPPNEQILTLRIPDLYAPSTSKLHSLAVSVKYLHIPSSNLLCL